MLWESSNILTGKDLQFDWEVWTKPKVKSSFTNSVLQHKCVYTSVWVSLRYTEKVLFVRRCDAFMYKKFS